MPWALQGGTPLRGWKRLPRRRSTFVLGLEGVNKRTSGQEAGISVRMLLDLQAAEKKFVILNRGSSGFRAG